MLIGYMRVSTGEQSLDLQRDALERAGCERVYEDVCSGRATERPGLAPALEVARDGDALAVWKLDRRGRSLQRWPGKTAQGDKWIFCLPAAIMPHDRETRAKRGLRGSFHVWMPALEAFAQVAIETLGAGLKQKVCASFGPSHLLFFDHTAGQHLIDG